MLAGPADDYFVLTRHSEVYHPRMKIGMATLAALLTVHVSAQTPKTAAAQTVHGTWTLNAEGYVLPMTLQQDGTRLTGTLRVTHGPFPLTGEFKKGRIHFAGTSDGGGIRHDDDSNEIDVMAIGRLQPDGSLAGTMVSTVGDFTWIATRSESARDLLERPD